MAKKFSKSFYDSKRWRQCRAAYIQHRIGIDGGMCETCHKEIGYIVHHKIELTEQNIDDDTITLNFNNLEYDCKHCHDRKDGHFVRRSKDNTLLVSFDENGDVIAPL